MFFKVFYHGDLPSSWWHQREWGCNLQYVRSSCQLWPAPSGQTALRVRGSWSCFLRWLSAWCEGQWYPEFWPKVQNNVKFDYANIIIINTKYNTDIPHFYASHTIHLVWFWNILIYRIKCQLANFTFYKTKPLPLTNGQCRSFHVLIEGQPQN